jgi:hypothetical protein
MNDETGGMIKHGRCVPGKTPSAAGGGPCDRVQDGEPIRAGQTVNDPGLRKLAAALSVEDGEINED